MASGSFGVSTSNGYISGSINWSESQQNSTNDTSVVYAEMRLSRTNGYNSYGTDDFWISINGQVIHSGQESYSLTLNSNTLMVSGSVTVTHNSDGSYGCPISWGGGGGSGGVFSVNSSSGTAYLDTLPRASTVASSTSWNADGSGLPISLHVADSSFHHSIQIFVQHTYDGNWDQIGQRDNIGSSTTWQFTQAEMTQIYRTNNMYENRPTIIRVFTYNSSGSQIGGYQDATGTVYAIPTAWASFANFNIGDPINYTLQNYTSGSAGGFTYDLTMTIGSFTKTWAATTAQTGTLTFTTAEVQSMYAQTPNANSIGGTMTVRTKYNGVLTEDGVPNPHDSTFTCYVTGSTPSFGTGYTYADTNSTVVAITNNSQYIVQNQSKLTVTLPKASAATANNAATMSYYTFIAANTAATMYIPITAPTLSTATTGGLLAAGTYYVVYTWVNSVGESYSSPETSIVVPSGTTTNKITVTIPSLPTGITSANIYISTATGTETKQGNTTTTTYSQTAALVAGAALPAMTINLGTINASSNTNLQVKAVDSRGNYLTTSINVNVVPYSAPTIVAAATRNNGFDASTVLSLNGVASAVSISSVNKNSIVSAQYQTRQKGGSFGSLTNFTVTGFPNYSVTNVTLTLDNTLAWDINFVVTDKFGTTSIIQSITAGIPIVAMDSVKKSVGVGQFPANNNSFEVAGSIYEGGTLVQDKYAPTGSITMYAAATAPSGYLLCQGQAVSRTTYSKLFGLIGTIYGTGDGSTTFNLPNLQSQVPVGLNSADPNFNTLGLHGGESTHTLLTNEMPSHSHTYNKQNANAYGVTFNTLLGNTNYGSVSTGTAGLSTGHTEGYMTIDNTGGGAAHNNLQPYITLNFIIKT